MGIGRSLGRGRLFVGVALALVVLAPAASATAGHSGGSRAVTGPRLLLRKSATELTPAERHSYVAAVLKLKHTPSPYPQDRSRGWSWYDSFVNWHVLSTECGATDLNTHPGLQAHNGPEFLAWHREFLLLFERALDTVSHSRIALPYWDWTDHDSVAKVFTDDFMGGDGDPNDHYYVNRGPFTKASWPLTVRNNHGAINTTIATTPYLVRHMKAASALPTMTDVTTAFQATHYDVAPYNDAADPTQSFRNAIEGYKTGGGPSGSGCAPDDPQGKGGSMGNLLAVPRGGILHNAVHAWFGALNEVSADGLNTASTMNALPSSPNDPIFFLHHAEIDRFWAEWQQLHPDQTYAPSSGYPNNELNSELTPFNAYGIHVTAAQLLDVTRLGYRYTRPTTDVAGASGGRGVSWADNRLLCS